MMIATALPTGEECPTGLAPIRVALAGNPNVGKTTLFNSLTGLHQHVGNWPGKTVERAEGSCRCQDRSLAVVDLPGTYSLTSHTAEEVIARDYILRERPDVVVVVLDAANLERNCYLLAQVLELTDRVVVALNMLDLARSRGYDISPERMAKALGVPVVPLVASRGEGREELLAAVLGVACGSIQTHPSPINYLQAKPTLRELEHLLAGRRLQGYPASWVALKLLEGDAEVSRLVEAEVRPGLAEQIRDLLAQHEHEPAVLADARYAWIAGVLAAAMARPARSVVTLTDRLDHLFTHRYLGLPLLFAIFLGMFAATFRLAAPLTGLIDYGMAALASWTAAHLHWAPAWLSGLISAGLIPGVGGVLAFAPIILLFFVFLGALEESGYSARAAFVVDRLMHALGLHGKAFLPLLLGYGCNVPGIMAARILENRRDRLLCILVNSLIPCPARVAVAAFLVGAFFPVALQPVIMGGLYLLSLLMVLAAGFALRKLALPGEQSPLMMELPLYRLPSLRNLGLLTWWRLVAFLRKAGTVIVAASVLIWALSTFPTGHGPEGTWLAGLGRVLAPVAGLIGLDWRMAVALVTGFVGKEMSLAALGVLYHADGQALATALQHQITPLVALVFVVVQLLYVPCLATVAVIRSETGSWKWTAVAVAYPLLLAGGLGALIYWGGRALGLG